jgi:hypothetical protein
MPTTEQIIKIGQGEDAEIIRFDWKKFLNTEAIAIERKFGLDWVQVQLGVAAGRLSAVTAIVWVIRKRSNPKLLPDEVVFNVGDYDIIDPDVDPEYGGTPLDDDGNPQDETPAEMAGPKDGTGSPQTSTNPE